jgi:cytochrome c oxidase cbb3-type subunit 2
MRWCWNFISFFSRFPNALDKKGQRMAGSVIILVLTFGLTLVHAEQRAMAQDHNQLGARVQQLEQQAIRDRGQQLYRQACAPCHGIGGDGQGPAAAGLYPKPHDFTMGMYKFRTTPLGTIPTDADLVRTIREGIPGTAMPAWKHLLSTSQQIALAQYLKTFAADAFTRQTPRTPALPHPLPPAPTATPEHVQRGRRIYERLQCGQCHGPDGRGNGPLVDHLRDIRNRPIRPTNFARGIYKSGVTPEDLLRTVWTGLAGTPMPAWSGAISIEEGWDLVHYIRSLSKAKTFWQRVFVDSGEAYPGR